MSLEKMSILLKIFTASYLLTKLITWTVKRLLTMQETGVRSLGREDPLEKKMAPHSSTLAWKIPWTEEPDGLQSMGVTKKLDLTEHAHTAWYPFSPVVT